DALRDVRKQYRRNKLLFANHPGSPTDDELPVFGTMASKFNDMGVNALFKEIIRSVDFSYNTELDIIPAHRASDKKQSVIPASRSNYRRDISDTVRKYNEESKIAVEKLQKYEAVLNASKILNGNKELEAKKVELEKEVIAELKEVQAFDEIIKQYENGEYTYVVRGKDIKVPTKYTSLSQQRISKVGFPRCYYESGKVRLSRTENLPGFYPFVGGVFPFKRADEDPKHQFAGEGGPKRTNARFHYLSKNDTAKRLSTAFDSVTLYGEGPD